MHALHGVTRLMIPMGLALSGAPGGDVGGPIRGLSPAELARFADGRTAFEATEVVADGLGPVFNDTSCVACHDGGATGGGSAVLETRFGTTTDGAFDPLPGLGGSLVQTDGIGAEGACVFAGERVPAQATIVARRRATPLFGLGLVETVPDTRLVALADRQARRQPETAGRPNLVLDVVSGAMAVGRFGWKSQVANLLHFSADAYLNEMGITTPLAPEESCSQGDCTELACDPVPGVDDDLEDVERFADFMRFLAPPSRGIDGAPRRSFTAGAPDATAADGSRLFDRVGCGSCHLRSLTSGASPVAALRGRTFHPYSDFLLHDMGGLGDGIVQGQATGSEMRTAPLWGLRLLTTYLHDGRASTVEDAILAHDGQGAAAAHRFAALPAAEQAALVAFLRTL